MYDLTNAPEKEPMKLFFKNMFSVALPVIVQNLVSSSLHLVDTVMIGQLGEVSIAAVSLANQWVFLLRLFIFGCISGMSVFTAQYYGRGDKDGVRRAELLALIISTVGMLLFASAAFFAPSAIMSFYTSDPAAAVPGEEYLRIIAFSYLVLPVSSVLMTALRSTDSPRLPMYASVSAILINTFLNWVLIFGNLGFPAMGIRGAAIATVIACAAEAAIMIIATYAKKLTAAIYLRSLPRIDKAFVKQYIFVALPVLINEVLWSFGTTLYAAIYARIGTSVTAAVNIVGTVSNFSFVVVQGVGTACGVIIGKQIGAGKYGEARITARRYSILGPVLSTITALIIILLRAPIISLFNLEPESRELVGLLLVLLIVPVSTNGFIYIGLLGILRAAGDTKACMIIDLAGLWLIALPLMALGVFVWHLPAYIVYLLQGCESIAKIGPIFYRVFIKKNWIRAV